jgi:hypothetical protein
MIDHIKYLLDCLKKRVSNLLKLMKSILNSQVMGAEWTAEEVIIITNNLRISLRGQ